MDELVFEVTQEGDAGYCAECLTDSIFTQGETWDELRANVKEAVDAFYFDGPKPASAVRANYFSGQDNLPQRRRVRKGGSPN